MTDHRTRARGRPRRFDEDAALDAALRLFWQQGYAETSMAQLREATGLSNASLTNAFGSKEQLFARVVERYAASYGAVTNAATDSSLSPREALEHALRDSARMQSDPTHPSGCLFVLSATACGPDNTGAAGIVAARRTAVREKLGCAIRRGIDAGELPPTSNVRALITVFHAFTVGISTEVRDGADVDELQAAIDEAMRIWDALASTEHRASSQ